MVRKRKGFALIATAVSSLVLLAVLGLALDLGRLYVINSELQSFADAAALAAAFEMDGTTAGLTRADAVAVTGPTTGGAAANRYYFSSKAVSAPQAAYSATFGGTYQNSAAAPVTARFVQVTTTASVPLYFLPLLPGVTTNFSSSKQAVAGQALQPSIGEGLAPFSPDAHSAAAVNFGFTVGQQYTLKWPPKGQRGKAGNTCGGDGGFTPPNSSSDRGYIDVGQGNGNSALHDTIVNNDYNLAQPYQVGSVINWVPGNKNVQPGVAERIAQDTDTASATYSAYTGNGRRILVVPVNDDLNPARVVGFAAFFMPPGMCGPQNTSPCCAEYLGPGLVDSSHKGSGGGGSGAGSSAGLYAVRLFR